LPGIAKPTPMLPAEAPSTEALAVVTPTTRPVPSTSGPPELPGLIEASVWTASHADPPAAELLARGTVAHADRVHVAGISLWTRGPVDVATVHVTFQPGGSTGWHVHPGPALVTVKTGQLTLHRAKGCRTRTFGAGQTFLELGPADVNLTRNETGTVTETVVTFLLPEGAPTTVDAPAPSHCPW
jgi:quercetin dioxygenase-like cupin family protein